MAVERAGEDREVLRLRVRHGLEERAQAARVRGDRLLREDVLARRHAGGDVARTEDRRRAEEHDVAPGGDHVLVAVRPAERHLLVDAVLLADFLRLVGEEVRRGRQLHLAAEQRGRVHDVLDRARAASAAAHEAHLEHLLGVAQHRRGGGDRAHAQHEFPS